MQNTRDLIVFLLDQNTNQGMRAVGRALVCLYRRQTSDEQVSATTRYTNSRGFNACDARRGTIHAKQFERHHHLTQAQWRYWTEPVGKNGKSRIAKYADQLMQCAAERQMRKLDQQANDPTFVAKTNREAAYYQGA